LRVQTQRIFEKLRGPQVFQYTKQLGRALLSDDDLSNVFEVTDQAFHIGEQLPVLAGQMIIQFCEEIRELTATGIRGEELDESRLFTLKDLHYPAEMTQPRRLQAILNIVHDEVHAREYVAHVVQHA